MKKDEVLSSIKNKLIVSCQTSENNPLYTAEHMLLLADASKRAGCCGFRVDTPLHIHAIKQAFPKLPVIGIWKVVYEQSDVWITPTMKEVDALFDEGVEIIAIDGTNRISPNGVPANQLILAIREKYPDMIIMADIATVEEASICSKLGADIISTTLHGYTDESHNAQQHDFDVDFIKEVRNVTSCFLIAEGKIWTREDALKAIQNGADAVVVGTAINNPLCISERFISYLKENG